MGKKMTTELFIEKANSVHNYGYNYDNTIYINSDEKVIITCLIHGDYKQRSTDHLSGNGCPSCGQDKRNKSKTLTFSEFSNRGKLIHNNFYIYCEDDYINASTKTKIICPEHGEFWQKPTTHINHTKNGCQKCGFSKIKNKLSDSFDDACLKFNLIYNYKYDYTNAIYNGNENSIEIKCPIHGSFFTSPSSHKRGIECSQCNKKSRGIGTNRKEFIKKYKDKLCTFYMVLCWNDSEKFIKTGITGQISVDSRLSGGLPYNYKILKTIINTPERIWDIEKSFKLDNRSLLYKPENKFCGWTECFNTNILNLITWGN